MIGSKSERNRIKIRIEFNSAKGQRLSPHNIVVHRAKRLDDFLNTVTVQISKRVCMIECVLSDPFFVSVQLSIGPHLP